MITSWPCCSHGIQSYMYVGRSYMEFQIKISTQKSFLRFLKEENDYHVKIYLFYIALSKELFAICLTLTTLTSTLLPPQLINQGWNIHMRNHPQLSFIYWYRQSRDGSGFRFVYFGSNLDLLAILGVVPSIYRNTVGNLTLQIWIRYQSLYRISGGIKGTTLKITKIVPLTMTTVVPSPTLIG